MILSLRDRLRFFARRKISPQLQATAAECGCACLAMIAGFHGHQVTISELRQRWPISLRGLTVAQIAEFADDIGLTARSLRLEANELHKLQLPCLLHWRLNHFVVLDRVRRGSFEIIDPAIGHRTLTSKHLAEAFSGIAVELAPTSRFKARRLQRHLRLRHFFANARGIKSGLLQMLGLSLALQAFVLIVPFYSQLVIDDVVVSGDLKLLQLAGTGFCILALFIAIAAALRSWVVVYIGSRLNIEWTASVFNHLVHLPYAFFEKRHTGDIQSRFGSLNAVRQLLTSEAVETIVDGLMAATTLALMLLYSPSLTAIVGVFLFAYLMFRLLSFQSLRNASREQLVRSASRDTYFLETLRGIVPIRNFGYEVGRVTAFQARASESIAAAADVARIGVWQQFAHRLLMGLQNVIVIWLAATAIADNRFTVGMMIAFLAYNSQFANRTIALVNHFFQFKLIRVHLERLEDIVMASSERTQRAGNRLRCSASSHAPSLTARGLGFRYGHNQKWVFEDLRLNVAPGEQVAIAGPSGTGKSTLLKLLVGLLEPGRGSIYIDGKPIAHIGLREYRQQIGVVMQDDRLFAGTILDNVAFFASVPDIANAERACEIAGILDDIAAMPMQFYTLVGDMGDTLSGGQRQRLLLARALYRQPRILFLDEATSHLDATKEATLVRAISALDMTRIVIAHRAETLRHADRIFTLD